MQAALLALCFSSASAHTYTYTHTEVVITVKESPNERLMLFLVMIVFIFGHIGHFSALDHIEFSHEASPFLSSDSHTSSSE